MTKHAIGPCSMPCLAKPFTIHPTLFYLVLLTLPCTALLLDLYPLYYSHHNHLHYRPNPSAITTLPQLPPSCYEEKCQACNRSSQAVNRKVQRRDMTSTALTSLLSHPIKCFGSLCSSFSHFPSHSSTNSPFRIVTHCTALHCTYCILSTLYCRCTSSAQATMQTAPGSRQSGTPNCPL